MLRKLWAERAAEIAPEIIAAVADQRFADAYKIIDGIAFDDHCTEATDYVKPVLNECIAFGAGLVTPWKQTAVLNGAPWPKDIVTNALVAMFNGLSTNGTEAVKTYLRNQVQVAEEKAKAPALTVAKAADEALAQALNKAVLGSGRVAVNVAANLTTTRLVAYGTVSELAATGATAYRWTAILDGTTCALCRTSHGKKFEVQRALTRLDGLLRMTNPNDLKAASPWPKDAGAFSQLTIEELTERGWGVPPLHPFAGASWSGSIAHWPPRRSRSRKQHGVPCSALARTPTNRRPEIKRRETTMSYFQNVQRMQRQTLKTAGIDVYASPLTVRKSAAQPARHVPLIDTALRKSDGGDVPVNARGLIDTGVRKAQTIPATDRSDADATSHEHGRPPEPPAGEHVKYTTMQATVLEAMRASGVSAALIAQLEAEYRAANLASGTVASGTVAKRQRPVATIVKTGTHIPPIDTAFGRPN
jgi:hypothetical protein